MFDIIGRMTPSIIEYSVERKKKEREGVHTLLLVINNIFKWHIMQKAKGFFVTEMYNESQTIGPD